MFQKYLFHCTEKCISALNIGIKEMVNVGRTDLSPDFILLGLIEQQDSSIMRIVTEMGANAEDVRENIITELYARQELNKTANPHMNFNPNITISKEVENLFEIALDKSKELGDKYISASLLFVSMFGKAAGDVSDVLRKAGLNEKDVLDAYMSLRSGRKVEDKKADSKEDVLSVYTTDLTALARQGKLDPVIAREEEIMQIIHVLSRRKKNNPILIGKPGVGKTVLVEGLAQRIVNTDVPENLIGKKIVSLQMSELVAGAKFKGEFEERLKSVREEIMAASGSIILFIDEFHTVISSSGPGEAATASNMLKPVLANGTLQCIGATTIDEYKKYVETDKALARRLQSIFIEEPTVKETVKILNGLIDHYEEHHSLQYTPEAIEAAARLSDRYISERYLPDKAIDIIDEAGARVHLAHTYVSPQIKKIESDKLRLQDEQSEAFAEKNFKKVAELQQEIMALESELNVQKKEWKKNFFSRDIQVAEDDIAKVVSKWTGIPLTRLVESESEKLTKMEDKIHKRIAGQNQAIIAVCNAIRRNRAGLKLHNRPIGSFLFLGPTGVGKTELAKALAEFLLDDENKIIRIDMSEYQERHSVARIIGSPPGYVGYGEGGQLTEKVRRNPYSVILLDEIEKAHPDVFNLLLQILDNGKLTDGQGLEVSFRNTVIIGTSNIGGSVLSKEVAQVGFIQAKGMEGYEETKKSVMSEVKKFFRPEFINRLDDIIVFHPLMKEHIKEIVDFELKKLEKGLKEQEIYLTVDEKVKDFLAEIGYSEIYGARPLKREIERVIENPISQQIIAGNVCKDMKINAILEDKTVKIICEEDELEL